AGRAGGEELPVVGVVMERELEHAVLVVDPLDAARRRRRRGEERRLAATGPHDELPGAGRVDRALVVTGGRAGRLGHAHVVEHLVVVVVAGEDDVGAGVLEHLPVGVGLGVVGRRPRVVGGHRRGGVVVLGEEPGAVPHGDDVLVGGGGLLKVAGQPHALGVGGAAARAAART